MRRKIIDLDPESAGSYYGLVRAQGRAYRWSFRQSQLLKMVIIVVYLSWFQVLSVPLKVRFNLITQLQLQRVIYFGDCQLLVSRFHNLTRGTIE